MHDRLQTALLAGLRVFMVALCCWSRRRSFASGTAAVFDTRTNTGNISWARAGLPLKTDAPMAAPKKNKIRYISWYSGPSKRPGKEYTNLAQHGNLSFLRTSHAELGVPGMLQLDKSRWGTLQKPPIPWIHVTDPIFDQTGPATVLTATWEAAVDDCIATVAPLAKNNGGYVHGIQLGDELVCSSGFPLSNLSALAARVHDGLSQHGVFVFTLAWPPRYRWHLGCILLKIVAD
eukprot:COSAG04_NODE_8313_length_992_cov_0.852184_1_plen_232_part_01